MRSPARSRTVLPRKPPQPPPPSDAFWGWERRWEHRAPLEYRWEYRWSTKAPLEYRWEYRWSTKAPLEYRWEYLAWGQGDAPLSGFQ